MRSTCPVPRARNREAAADEIGEESGLTALRRWCGRTAATLDCHEGPDEESRLVASVVEVLGALRQGRTRAGARANVIDALRLMPSQDESDPHMAIGRSESPELTLAGVKRHDFARRRAGHCARRAGRRRWARHGAGAPGFARRGMRGSKVPSVAAIGTAATASSAATGAPVAPGGSVAPDTGSYPAGGPAAAFDDCLHTHGCRTCPAPAPASCRHLSGSTRTRRCSRRRPRSAPPALVSHRLGRARVREVHA